MILHYRIQKIIFSNQFLNDRNGSTSSGGVRQHRDELQKSAAFGDSLRKVELGRHTKPAE